MLRTTESSVRMWIGRSWTRKASAISPSRLAGVLVAVGDRLVRDVRRGHDQRAAEVGEKHVLEGRVGEHHAEVAGERRHRLGDRRPVATPGDHDRPLASEQELLLGWRQLDQRARLLDARRHQREWLLLTLLAAPERTDCLLGSRVAGEVIAADPLDGQDRAVGKHRRRLQRSRRPPSGARLRGPGTRRARGAAGWAGVRLRVEAAVERVVVFGLALGAHPEARHRRLRAVVGDALDDREARAAVRAVDERVAVAPVGGVGELGQARVARGHVGGDQRVRLAVALGRQDAEAALARGLDALGGNRLDHGEWRRLVLQEEDELADRRLGPLGLDHDAVLVVQDVAGEPELERGAIDERPEPNALDRPGDPDRGPAGAQVAHPTLTQPTRPARGARGRRLPAPPGCAGCAGSG